MSLHLYKKICAFFIFMCVLFFLVLTQTVEAGSLVPCSGNDCGTCQIVQLADNTIDILIELSLAIAVLVFIWGGWLMLSAAGNSTQIARGKSALTNALVGLIIVLTAWLIVDVMLKSLLSNNGEVATATGSLPWNQIVCTSPFDLEDSRQQFPGDSDWINSGGNAPPPVDLDNPGPS